MSDKRDPSTDQAMPVVNNHPYIQDLVSKDIEKRKNFGIAKYGTALQPFNGRSMLLDAYEEALDLVIYLKGCIVEQEEYQRINSMSPTEAVEPDYSNLDEQDTPLEGL